MHPAPGTATEADVVAAERDDNRLYERVDGVLVEKVPELAVEVLSESNTPREMERKRQEYFKFGVQLVWMVDPNTRAIQVFTSPENPTTLRESDVLDGGTVLVGFTLAIKELFAELDI
jgi:Uma2 family endonuclease